VLAIHPVVLADHPQLGLGEEGGDGRLSFLEEQGEAVDFLRGCDDGPIRLIDEMEAAQLTAAAMIPASSCSLSSGSRHQHVYSRSCGLLRDSRGAPLSGHRGGHSRNVRLRFFQRSGDGGS
jgi:hypothetical protein